jgi:hypothetical protein
VSQHLQPVVRAFIRAANLKGQRVSIDRVRLFLMEECQIEIPRATLGRTRSRWGCVHGEGRRWCALKEQSDVVHARRAYLRAKRGNRHADGSLKRPEVYLDETYINKNHSSRFTWYLGEDGPRVNKPSGVGPRCIIVHAITQDGWVPEAQLVFEAKRCTGDYHGQMNWENFSRWVTVQLLPHVPPNALIILDHPGDHNVFVEQAFPTRTTSREEMRAWLNRTNIPWRDDMLKSELLEVCRRFSPTPEYQRDRIAAEHGHRIVRTPPYHPALQPIETCWAIVKNSMADHGDFTMGNLRTQWPMAFSQVTQDVCQRVILNVAEQEERFWVEDEQLDEIYSQDDDVTYVGEDIAGELAEESLLE